jgi:hypothetical protein
MSAALFKRRRGKSEMKKYLIQHDLAGFFKTTSASGCLTDARVLADSLGCSVRILDEDCCEIWCNEAATT